MSRSRPGSALRCVSTVGAVRALSTETRRARLLSHEISLCGAVVIGPVDTVDNLRLCRSSPEFLSTELVDGGCGKLVRLWMEEGCPQVVHRPSTGYPPVYPQILSWGDPTSWRVIHRVSTGCPQVNGGYPQGYPRLIHSLGCARRPSPRGGTAGEQGGGPPRSERLHSPDRGPPPLSRACGQVGGAARRPRLRCCATAA